MYVCVSRVVTLLVDIRSMVGVRADSRVIAAVDSSRLLLRRLLSTSSR